jgi:hypothetical protein
MVHEFAIVRKPRVASEFEMQAELYFRLKRLGLDVRGEVPAEYQSERSFFDLVVFHGDYGAVIIEVKNSAALHAIYGGNVRQNRKYKAYDIPLVYYTTATPIEDVIATVQRHLEAIGAA